MGRGRQGSGVTPLKTTIRVRFTWSGQRQVYTLPLAPTSANIKAAERLMLSIRRDIERGIFEPGNYFKNSLITDAAQTSFEAYADKWMGSLTVAHSTAGQYKGVINGVWKPAFIGKTMAEIKHAPFEKWRKLLILLGKEWSEWQDLNLPAGGKGRTQEERIAEKTKALLLWSPPLSYVLVTELVTEIACPNCLAPSR